MKLVDIETKITAILWDDEHEEETEREMTVGEFLDEFTAEGLLEIPLYAMGAPHGRLIEADALDINRREERAWIDIKDAPFSEYLEGVKDGLHEAAKCVSTAPTIIPAEEGNGDVE